MHALFLIILIVPLAFLTAILGLLLYWSYPGRPTPFFADDGGPLPGSISEKIRVCIGGVDQGMIIRGKDQTKPVLLYLHGGLPEYFLTERHPTGLEELFTVCWWDQRGSGLSFSHKIPRDTITVERLVSDTIELSEYLRRRFKQPRIYLMGHSGGSFLGMLTIARAPHLYHAYIGVAQMSHQLKSERLAYDFMLKEFKRLGNKRMVQKLEDAPVTLEGGVPAAYLAIRDPAMHALGVGTTRAMRSVFSGIFLPSLQSRQYTLTEKLNLWYGKATTGVSSMWNEMLETDLSEVVASVEVPVYFFHGIHDYTCSYTEAEAYFKKLRAPSKGFYRFWESAHSPHLEEPEKALRILREDVLQGAHQLADLT